MAKLFASAGSEGLEKTEDRLGGFALKESGLYEGVIKLAYAGASQAEGSKSQSITFHIDLDGHEHRETLWVTNREGKNYFFDKNDKKKKRPLPGFTVANDLCLLTTGYELEDQEFEDKTVNLYDFEQKREIPQSVPVMTALLGEKVIIGLLKSVVDKQEKNATTGVYENSGETRELNEIDKVFHHEMRKTVVEIREDLDPEVLFIDKWDEKNSGQTRNKAKGKGQAGGGAPARSGGASGSGSAPAPKSSLFVK